jgi:hypothetical protein
LLRYTSSRCDPASFTYAPKRKSSKGAPVPAAYASGTKGASSRRAGDPIKEILRIAIAAVGIDGASRLLLEANTRLSLIV